MLSPPLLLHPTPRSATHGRFVSYCCTPTTVEGTCLHGTPAKNALAAQLVSTSPPNCADAILIHSAQLTAPSSEKGITKQLSTLMETDTPSCLAADSPPLRFPFVLPWAGSTTVAFKGLSQVDSHMSDAGEFSPRRHQFGPFSSLFH